MFLSCRKHFYAILRIFVRGGLYEFFPSREGGYSRGGYTRGFTVIHESLQYIPSPERKICVSSGGSLLYNFQLPLQKRFGLLMVFIQNLTTNQQRLLVYPHIWPALPFLWYILKAFYAFNFLHLKTENWDMNFRILTPTQYCHVTIKSPLQLYHTLAVCFQFLA